MEINPKALIGNWRFGWALDLHTQPSETKDYERTEIGQALYELKYCSDERKVEPIAEVAAAFLKTRKVTPYLEAIIPIPPSDTTRRFQPVWALAKAIGKKLGKKVDFDYLRKIKPTAQLKEIEDYDERKRILKDAFEVADLRYRGQKVLLFDDLYRSGATLWEATNTLLNNGGVDRVFVLTITKTRVKR